MIKLPAQYNNRTPQNYRRYLKASINTVAQTSSTYTAGRVYLIQIEIPQPVLASGIIISNISPAGNAIVGIYPEGSTNTPAAAAVKVQSADTALSGSNQPQEIAITPTVLSPGTYYIAVEFSDNTATVQRFPAVYVLPGQSFYYDRGGGYGTLTSPCPAVTASTATIPGVILHATKV